MDCWIFRRLLTFLCFLGAAFCVQEFESQPGYTEVNPGNEARMQCKVLNKAGSCIWQKDRKPIGIFPGKYEWAGNPDVGDCSLRILNARLDLDDGEWECQVTAAAFDSRDQLTSKSAQLVVRVAPTTLTIERNTTAIPPAGNTTVQAGSTAQIKCISRYGNPPPQLKWYLDGQELTHINNQTNTLEQDSPHRWHSSLLLSHNFEREDHGKALKCVAMHQAFVAKTRETGISLNVQYTPAVTLTGIPTGDLEEGVDSAILRCVADANPTATIIWRKTGSHDILAIQETLQIGPLTRRHSGTYTCEARNALGTSGPLTAELNVKYGPTEAVIEGTSGGQLAASYGGSARLECRAGGNPSPIFKWLQKFEPSEHGVMLKSDGKYLILKNVTYDDQGEYVCSASNFIGGRERIVQSVPVSLRVVGPPQFIVPTSARILTVERGDEAELSAKFCSDPKPIRATWQCGHVTVTVGTSNQRYVAESLKSMKRPSCYEAVLRVQRADIADARPFVLTIENEKGSDSVTINLRVTEPVSMTAVIGVIIACLIFLVLVTLCLLYAFRTERWCFRQKGDFKPAPDVESAKNGSTKNGLHIVKPINTSRSSLKAGNDLRFNDLQLPRASNNGSMRAKKGERGHGLPSVTAVPSSRPDVANITYSSPVHMKDKVDL